MTQLTVFREQGDNYTILSNQFIDQYMLSANDAQIKIYLYLLRMTGAGLPFSVSDIADRFNYMEQDVLRALCYWEKSGLLSLDFDSAHNLKAIHILPIPATEKNPVDLMSDLQPSSTPIQAEIVPITPKLAVSNTCARTQSIEKQNYSADDLVAFKTNNETAQMIFVAETYIGKPLSSSDLQVLLFIYDKLKFSTDLIDYLIQYCVGMGKTSFSYIQKVAINWSDSNITSIEQAKNQTGKYDKSVYTIMKALGKNSIPTDPEIAFIHRWTKEMLFPLDVILKACERTVLSTDKHRFEYTNGILTKWASAGVKTIKEVETFEGKHTPKAPSHSTGSDSGFNNFNQRSYDYNALEKALLSSN